jgi:ribosomal-protein-alanine N-acetyltransferase
MPAADDFVLETDRLILRRLTLDDLDALAELYTHPAVRQYIPEGVLTRDETREELESILRRQYGGYGYGLWATILKESGAFIGRCGLLPWETDAGLEVEVAYMLDEPYWGRGLATEAARAIAEYGFARLGLKRLVCYIYPQNAASRRVAEKIGMRFAKTLVEDNGEVSLVYSLEAQ